jgi:putative membrane protein
MHRLALAIVLAGVAGSALAHEVSASWAALDVDETIVIVACIAALVWYAAGLRRLWHQAGALRGLPMWRAGCFGAGIATLLVSVVGPLHEASHASFSAHMLQHEALMLLAAPLLVAGRPLAIAVWALPRAGRMASQRFFSLRWWSVVWNVITRPAGATLLQLAVLWFWHAPRLFDAAAGNAAIHACQHASFLAAALCFWFATLRGEGRGVESMRAIAWLFLTSIATGALGALLTFAPNVWYAGYSNSHSALVSSPLEDQQLGGLLMWIPGGTVYAAFALHIFGRMLARPAVARSTALRRHAT